MLRALEPLRVDGFRILPREDEGDTVVFGPSGGFLITLVGARGRIEVDWENELGDGTTTAHETAIQITDGRAHKLRMQMLRAGTAVWVHPIVVATRAHLTGPVAASGVIVCPPGALTDLLQRRRVLKPQMIERCVSAFSDLHRVRARAQ